MNRLKKQRCRHKHPGFMIWFNHWIVHACKRKKHEIVACLFCHSCWALSMSDHVRQSGGVTDILARCAENLLIFKIFQQNILTTLRQGIWVIIMIVSIIIINIINNNSHSIWIVYSFVVCCCYCCWIFIITNANAKYHL